MSVEKEAEAISRVSRSKRRQYASMVTTSNRYARSIARLVELARERKGEKLVVHIVGVGGLRGPQLRETIRAFTENAGKRVEMHVMDYSKPFLRRAMKAARDEFPGVDMTPYFLGKRSRRFDIAKAVALPRKKADFTICTSVLMHIDPPSNRLGLYQLASSLKKGGHLLVGGKDMQMLHDLKPADFGLEVQSWPIEEQSHIESIGFIFKKTRKERPFNEIWGKVK